MSAFTPDTMDEAKFTTPRMSGQPQMGWRSLMSFRSSTFVTSPSGERTTMACFCGPRI